MDGSEGWQILPHSSPARPFSVVKERQHHCWEYVDGHPITHDEGGFSWALGIRSSSSAPISKGGSVWCTDGLDIWTLFKMEFNGDFTEAVITPGEDLQRWRISPQLVDQIILAGKKALVRGPR